MTRKRKPERRDDIGFCVWDSAPGSFMACPRCGARALVRHAEPPSGGGDLRHEHRCTRCRHEWEAAPGQGRGCTIDECLPCTMDATTAGSLRAAGLLNLRLGRDETWPVPPLVAGAASSRTGKGRG